MPFRFSGRLSLQQRLFILVGVAIAPLLAILIYNELTLRREREAEVHALALQAGKAAAYEIDRILSGAEGVLTALASSDAVRRFEPGCAAYLSAVRSQLPQFNAITAVDFDGVPRCRSEPSNSLARLSDRSYFAQALSTGRFVVGEYTLGRLSNRPTLPLARPITDEGGRAVGVIVAGLKLDWLGERLKERDFSRGNALAIADRKGVIIAREPLPERFVGTPIPAPFNRLVDEASPGTREILSQDGARRVIGYVPPSVTGGLYVSAGLSQADAFAQLDRATVAAVAVSVAGSALAFLIALLSGRWFVQRPVARILKTIAAWRGGEPRSRTEMTPAEGELGSVGAAIDEMMDDLGKREAEALRFREHQELLINELNHRVKNTLAMVQAIAHQTFRADLPSDEIISSFERRLFALARAHDVLTRENWEGAELGEIAETALEPYRGQCPDRLKLAGPDVRLSPRTALGLAMTLQELATNATKYGALSNGEGVVRITWSVDRTAEPNLLSLRWSENGGPPVEAPVRRGFGSRLIERFLAQDLQGRAKLLFEPEGLVCEISAPVT